MREEKGREGKKRGEREKRQRGRGGKGSVGLEMHKELVYALKRFGPVVHVTREATDITCQY